MTRETREERARRLHTTGALQARKMAPVALQVAFPMLPPATNNLYMTIGKRRVLSTDARLWKSGAGVIIQNAMQQSAWELPPQTPYAVTVEVSHPRVFAFDLDGRLKLVLDAIGSAIGVDDRYIVALQARKQRGPEALTVTVIGCEP